MTIISIKDGEFIDEHGRILNLRGVNLGGSSKLPSDSSLNKQVTFVNRPFPLSEADLHFRRLQACGLTFIRFIVTWEAIEHKGPGLYDTEYLQYIRQLLQKAKEYNIQIYIDPHQDVWSRATGGDGAPLWTLELVGFDVSKLRLCEAAITQETWGTGFCTAEKKKGGAFPKMIWPTNYFKLACATMFTLFWAGERFAPQFMVDDEGQKVNIQSYLQNHYINAMAELLKALQGLDNIVGIGTMNEPSAGYINVADLNKSFAQSKLGGASVGGVVDELRYGLAPTPIQGMVLGEGRKQVVGEWSNGFMQHVLGKPNRYVTIDPKGKGVWKNESGCVWKQAGVWSWDANTSTLQLHKPNYFANVDFGKECYVPFASEYSKAMQSAWNGKSPLLIFVELPPLEFTSTPFPSISSEAVPNAVNATHWYDGVTLFTQSWHANFSVDMKTQRPKLGYANKFKLHSAALAEIKQLGTERMDNSPTLIGETGIPFNMNNAKAYTSGDFRQQLSAMDHTISCLEENNLNFTLWCYTSDNVNEHGDLWNREDLSIYCAEHPPG